MTPDVLDAIAPWVFLPIWGVIVLLLSRWLYRASASTYEYHLSDDALEVAFRWAGALRIRKRVPLREISGIRPVTSPWQIVPILSGTMPTLWGTLDTSRMLVIARRRKGLFPILITPSNAPGFLQDTLQRIAQAHDGPVAE